MEKKIGITHLGGLSAMSRALLIANEISHAQEELKDVVTIVEDNLLQRGVSINYRNPIDIPIVEPYPISFNKKRKPNKGFQIGSYKSKRK